MKISEHSTYKFYKNQHIDELILRENWIVNNDMRLKFESIYDEMWGNRTLEDLFQRKIDTKQIMNMMIQVYKGAI